MTTSLVTFEQKVIVKNMSPQEIIDLFDGLIPSDGLIIKNVRGKKLVAECVENDVTELIEIGEDGEELILLNRKADLTYYLSENKEFGINDKIRIDGKGDFTIIITPKFSFLYNCKDSTTIEMDRGSDIGDLKLYLGDHYPDYKVLRKIV